MLFLFGICVLLKIFTIFEKKFIVLKESLIPKKIFFLGGIESGAKG